MKPTPTAIGLVLCEQVIVDHRSKCPSPINIFTGFSVESFPSEPRPFSVFSSLTDGLGAGTLELIVVRMDTNERTFAQRYPIQFPDRRVVVNTHIRLRHIRFPVDGYYDFQLLIDGELVAQRMLRVYLERGANP